jgi:hypothetical protein
MNTPPPKIPKPKKLLRPAPDNRQAAVDVLRTGLGQTEERFSAGAAAELEMCNEHLSKGNLGGVSFRSATLFFESMGSIVNGMLHGDADAPDRLRLIFSRMYWGHVLAQHYWMNSNIGFDKPLRGESELVLFHGLALAGGADKIADWVAPFLLNLLICGRRANRGDYYNGFGETDFPEFYELLLSAQVSGNWIPRACLTDRLGYFRPLLEYADDPAAFAGALKHFCDFRLGRAFLFDSPEAKRPRKPSDPMTVYEAQWVAIFPLELFALQAIYRRATGRQLSLESDHPLLQTPLMNVPELLPLREDALTRSMQVLGRKIFGNGWDPESTVETFGAEKGTRRGR